MPLLNTLCAENYMEQPLRHDTRQTPGALGLGQAMATRTYCAFYLFYYVTPIFVAIVADSHLGRYVSLVVSTILYCLGCLAVTASSVPSSLERGWGTPGLAVAMVLVGLGGGGFRATIVPFIVDQQAWTEPRLITLNTGEVVVTDYQLTLQYICNLYYWSVSTLC
jgi:POT family proton-dependent oligopeptide transporter